MFDWFWEFLYLISKSLMKLCDWLMDCALVLAGIEPLNVSGSTDKDLLSYLITSDKITFAFAALSILAIVVLVLFTIFAILRTVVKEQPGQSPAQICIKAFKSLLLFLFVPTIMICLIMFLGEFMQAIFNAIAGGSNSTVGSFLFTTFAPSAEKYGQDGLSPAEKASFLSGNLDYYNTDEVETAIDLSEFSFIFSWIAGGVVAYNIAATLLIFVDRAISIVILYLAAPFSISASVLDEGAHFKTWREQILTKFLTAYGAIIAMYIYILITGLLVSDDVKLLSNSLLNYVAKILLILGGAQSMRKASTLVASLMSQGGAAEMNDPLVTKSRGIAAGALKGALKYNPVGMAARYAGGAVAGSISRKLQNTQGRMGNRFLNKMGIDTSYDNKRLGIEDDNNSEKLSSNPQYNDSEKNQQMKNALENSNGNKNNGNNNSNQNDKSPKSSKGAQMMNNALSNSGSKSNSGNKEE